MYSACLAAIGLVSFLSTSTPAAPIETMQQRIERVREDLDNLEHFYNIDVSPHRSERLRKYYEDQLTDLRKAPFESLDQEGKTDFLLLQNYLERNKRQIGRAHV